MLGVRGLARRSKGLLLQQSATNGSRLVTPACCVLLLLSSSYRSTSYFHSTTASSLYKTRLEEDEKGKKPNSSDKEDSDRWSFDISKDFNLDMDSIKAKIFSSNAAATNEAEASSKKQTSKQEEDGLDTLDVPRIAGDLMNVFFGRKKQESIQDIVTKVREKTGKGEVEDTTSLPNILQMLDTYKNSLEEVANKFLGGVELDQINPIALLYYIEHEDERKNPSWKRRQHLFYGGIDLDQLVDLNKSLTLADLTYADTVEEVRAALDKADYELVVCDLSSSPGKPAHFLAVKRNQSKWSSKLEVLMGVRGTKTPADALTDLLCDSAEYRGGKAHKFIVNSGQFLVERFTPILQELRQQAGKKFVKINLVGHSLGAGAASIAAIEFNDQLNFQANVVGFGCPALLSKELAEECAPYITTIVNDADMVPRLSGIAVMNLVLDIMQFDFYRYANLDVQRAVAEIRRRQPTFLPKEAIDSIGPLLEPLLKDFCKSTIQEKTTERVMPELFPPGKCIHFYRDGYGISASVVPNDFFCEIDVSRRMIDDHLFASGYQKTILEAMREHKQDLHFRFEDTATR